MNLESIKHGEFNISVKEIDNSVSVFFSGICEAQKPQDIIVPFFNTLVQELDQKSVNIDFTRLEYISSAAVSPLISVFKMLDSCNVATEIVYNKKLSWQKVTFTSIAGMLDNVKIHDE